MSSVRLTRRGALIGGAALAACAQAPQPDQQAGASEAAAARFAAIEARIGGRVGVAAWKTDGEQWLTHRANERFAMCSTFKWTLAAAILHSGQNGGVQLDQQVRFDQSDMVANSPHAQANLARGWMTVEEMCSATVRVSDNACANLLLEGLMGPEGFTNFLRANGDGVTRLDRIEPAMNQNLPGDPRDTTTPDAMTRTLHRFLLTDRVLNEFSRGKLIGWMEAASTGLQRIRGGLPAGWRAGDKTGTSTGENNATNDVAIIWPPNGAAPIVASVYLSHSTAAQPALNEAHAEIGRIVAETWSAA